MRSRSSGVQLRRRRLARLVMSLAALVSGCTTNPVTGKSEFVLGSAEREAALGRQAAKQVEQQIGLLQDPALTAWLRDLGSRLAAHSPRSGVPYRFAVVDMPEPNAFTLPGGYVYVSRGLLVLANSEAEVAAVVGHEIGHLAARHAAQRETRNIGVGLLTAFGTLAAGAAGGEQPGRSVAGFGQLAGAALIASYGREQERQADEVGQKLVAASGYDPAKLSTFLTTLERESELRTGMTPRPSFLDSHPLTRERIASTAARAADLQRVASPATVDDRSAFLARLDGLRVGPDPADGVFRAERFLHPGLGIVIDFPGEWSTRNGRDAVGALSPAEDAVIILERQGPTEDPRKAAHAYAASRGLPLGEGFDLKIGGWPAFRAWSEGRTESGPVQLDLTWIAHPKGTLRITSVSAAARFQRYAAGFRFVARSVRSMTRRERRSITELRLRIVEARRRESLRSLSRRTGNAWSIAETAVANGLSEDVRLGRGQPVKIVKQVRYASD